MQSPQEVGLPFLAARAYQIAFTLHGDLSLLLKPYIGHLVAIVNKRLGESPSEGAAFAFVNRLHTDDLYLSVACAHQSESAWNRLSALYGKRIDKIATSVCRRRSVAGELAESILGHIFLPDRSGRSRIASYDGLSSLLTWLRSVISHKATKEGHRKSNSFESLDGRPDIADFTVVPVIETDFRAAKYELLIKDSFMRASNSLTAREHFILALRYKERLQGAEIARVLGVHASTVTRQLQQVHEKLHNQVAAVYGPVRTVVWQGSAGDRCPYANQ
jgi:RNA polymerase sigma-70 factor